MMASDVNNNILIQFSLSSNFFLVDFDVNVDLNKMHDLHVHVQFLHLQASSTDPSCFSISVWISL